MKCDKCQIPEGSPAVCVHMAGHKGGTEVAKRGREFFQAIGSKGGKATLERNGTGFFQAIGSKGGETVRAERGRAYYEEIGRKGGRKVRELIAKGKAVS